MHAISARVMPRCRVSQPETGAGNGSARIQFRGVRTRTPTHWTVTREEAGLRLDQFLAAPDRLGSRGRARVALDRGQVFVNEAEANSSNASSRVASGDAVRLWLDRPGSRKRRAARDTGHLHILFEDEALLVVNKPAGLLTVPLGRRKDAPSLQRSIEMYLRARGDGRAFIVHRIDRDTSGLVIVAKTARAQQTLKAQFERREPERIYVALVRGLPRPPQGTWRDRIVWDQKALMQKHTGASDPKGMAAISHYRVLETFAGTALIEVRLQTGKRNQIRIQAALHGHPLVGERQYLADDSGQTTALSGNTAARSDGDAQFPRQALHAHRLSLRHPIDGRSLTFEAPLPADFDDLLRRLRRAT